jgi:site-specific DNA recombinase
MTRAAIYVRVSTSRQADRELSMPDQVAQCRAYCERQGWEIAELFEEPSASALDDDRPKFQELIYKASRADRPFDYVVVHSLSRFSRDAMHSEFYVRKLRKAGVEPRRLPVLASFRRRARTCRHRRRWCRAHPFGHFPRATAPGET